MTEPEDTASSCVKGKLGRKLGKKFFTERVIKYCNGMPEEVLESPSSGVLKGLDVALGVMVLLSCWGRDWTQ